MLGLWWTRPAAMASWWPAAEGNPWIFAEMKAALEGAPVPASPTAQERMDMAKRHVRMLHELKAGRLAPMRKHGAWYVSGLPGASVARGRLNQCTTVQEFCAVFDAVAERSHAA